MIIIDLDARKIVPDCSGVVGQMTFDRLIQNLRSSGEISACETITHLRIDVERGVIEYYVGRRS